MASRSQAIPSAREFVRLSREHSLIPVYRIVTADLETPVSAFLRIAAEEPEAFLLESVEGGEHVGRYTFIGIEPYQKIVSRGTSITVAAAGERRTFEGDIFAELKQALSGHTPARLPGLPPFTAGAVGFFSYDVVRQIERLPTLAKDELGVPDACLMFFDQVLAFDHVKKEIHLIVTADLKRDAAAGKTAMASYARAVKRLDRLEKRLARRLPKPAKKHATGKLKLAARTPKATFLKSVRRAKEYIAAGDVFQCVLSQRFDCVPGVDAFDIYRALRIVNPSPYMYFLRFGLEAPPTQSVDPLNAASEPEVAAGIGFSPRKGPALRAAEKLSNSAFRISGELVAQGFSLGSPAVSRTEKKGTLAPEAGSASHNAPTADPLPLKSGKKKKKLKKLKPAVAHIVGSSPELLVRVHGRTVEYRPIAGTRPRSADEVEDRAFDADLRADEKEVAEHVMLVDLGRNDVGRVSEYGSVKVNDLMFVERYSHVMHLVSSLEGKLKPELEPIDAFRACFPAGTLSGAPKIRAMEIIEELEPARRGVYGGSIFYADFSGNLDSCIAIRTLYMNGEQGHIQAGAGIVADSVPENEFVECGNKARAVVRAIERARQR